MDPMLIGVAVLPVIVLMIFIYFKDTYNKEPLRLLLKAFFFGVLSCLPAILTENVLSLFAPPEEQIVAHSLYMGFGVAGFSEELWKLLLLTLAIWRSREFDEYFDGIVYATFVSLGFACLENLGYVFASADYAGSLTTGIMRAIVSVPGHFLFGVTMGYFFSLAKFNPRRRLHNLFLALLIPMLLHGTFDSILFISNGSPLFSSILLICFIIFDIKMWKWGLRRIRHLQQLSQQQNFDRDHPFDGFTWNI